MRGLGAEVAKNIVLAGIKSLTLLDPTVVSVWIMVKLLVKLQLMSVSSMTLSDHCQSLEVGLH